MSKKVIWRGLLGLLVLLLILGAFLAHRYYNYIFSDNIALSAESCELYIYPNSSFGDLLDSLHTMSCIESEESFLWTAERMEFTSAKLRPGRYVIQQPMNNREFIQRLRSGNQDAINLVVPAARDLTVVAARAGNTLMPDSSLIADYFFGKELEEKFELDARQLKSRIIPNTYQMWWNSDPDDLVARLLREYELFWDKNQRREKADKIGLSAEEVIILASIVERESNYVPELPTIAGVYLNRLQSNWPLQADPTVVFAMGNPEIRRVLTRDLEIDSPYNTYKYPGLPPGPICIPSIHSIDAVLNPASHEYFFFCAKPDNSGAHVFSKTLSAHMQNARRFQNWLNQQRIMR